MSQKRGNLLISSVIALGALAFFVWRGDSNDTQGKLQKSQEAPQGSFASGLQANPANQAGLAKRPIPANDKDFMNAVSAGNKNRKIPGDLPEDLKQQLMAPPPPIPADIVEQMKAPPPPIPPEMQAQLDSPPPPLPADLAAQLEGPPPELPEDMVRALNTPPRVVTIDEVNDPNFVP